MSEANRNEGQIPKDRYDQKVEEVEELKEKIEKEKTFTQDEINRAVEKRVAREKRKHAEELEQIRAEEGELPEGTRNYKAEYFDNMKRVKLLEAGLSLEKIEKYVKYIDGETEEEVIAQAGDIAADVSKKGSKYADPESEASRKTKGVWNPFK